MDKRYIVWTRRADGWWPSRAMTRDEADTLAEQLDADGRSYRVVPAPRFDAREE